MSDADRQSTTLNRSEFLTQLAASENGSLGAVNMFADVCSVTVKSSIYM